MTSSFPRHQTSGMTPTLPAMKTPMAVPQDPVAPPMPALPAIKAPKVKGTQVGLKKPKPPSSAMRDQNGL